MTKKNAPASSAPASARILLLEDDEYLRAILKQALVRCGCTVADAANGNEGIELFRQQTFDLAIIDLVMPEKDGLETIPELKRLSPNVKIIAISGGGRFGDKDDYLRVAKCIGAIETLKKPFTDDVLVAAVARVLISARTPR